MKTKLPKRKKKENKIVYKRVLLSVDELKIIVRALEVDIEEHGDDGEYTKDGLMSDIKMVIAGNL